MFKDVTALLRKSGVRVNREKSVLIPRTSLEFLGAIWSQSAIERAPHITKTINTLIFRMATQPLTLKQVEQASGFLNTATKQPRIQFFKKPRTHFVPAFYSIWEIHKTSQTNNQSIFIYINRFIVPVNVVYVPSAENQADGLSRL